MPARLSADHPHVATAADGNALISQRIAEGEPFIAGRLGTNEICVLRANLTAVPRGLPRCSGGGFHGTSGIYPETPRMIHSFARTYEASVRSLRKRDVVGAFRLRAKKELPLFRSLAPAARVVEAAALAPFLHASPWSAALENKTVAVVHPFGESIECQLRRRARLFRDQSVLPPSTTWKVVHMYQALGRCEPHGSWTETLEASKRRLDAAMPFDVAIIGAGSYGMPIAAHVRDRLRRSAVVMGGFTQTLFGIRGDRWEVKGIAAPRVRSSGAVVIPFDSHPAAPLAQVHRLTSEGGAAWMYPLRGDMPRGVVASTSRAQSTQGADYFAPSRAQSPARCPLDAQGGQPGGVAGDAGQDSAAAESQSGRAERDYSY